MSDQSDQQFPKGQMPPEIDIAETDEIIASVDEPYVATDVEIEAEQDDDFGDPEHPDPGTDEVTVQ